MKNVNSALSRRSFLSISALGGASLVLAGCDTTSSAMNLYPTGPQARVVPPAPSLPDNATMYAAMQDEGFDLPAIPWEKIDQSFLRQVVPNTTGQPEGTLLVDTLGHHLYFTVPGGHAVRYGVGLGRAGFEWSGAGLIQWKRKWPTWTPPDEMIARDPKLAPYSAKNGGMKPGLKNPLGARAHYIFQDGKDTLFRVHGTPEWNSIGKSVSSGCVRMMNQDVIDLYDRVDKTPKKAPIIVVNGVNAPIVEQRLPSSMPIDSGLPQDAYVVGPANGSSPGQLVGPADDPMPADDF